MTKLRDAIYGLAIADALGVPFEFKKREGDFHLHRHGGFWNLEPGCWDLV